jgi:hypothetical protein
MRVRQEVSQPLLQGDSLKTGGFCEGCKRRIRSSMVDNNRLEDLLEDWCTSHYASVLPTKDGDAFPVQETSPGRPLHRRVNVEEFAQLVRRDQGSACPNFSQG